MQDQPLVSVLMTAFNREKYIAEAIESLLNSTYKKFELIIVDDVSTDKTLAIAKAYAEKDERIKVYGNEKNLGDYHNRNKSASLAKGKYLKYLDSDDTIYPHGLEVMVNAIEKFPSAGIGIQSNIREDNFPYPYLASSKEVYQEFFLKGSFPLAGPTGTIIKRSVFEELGGFSGRRYIGDTEMWLKIASKYPVVKFQPSLIWWRQHEQQEFKHGNNVEGYFKMNYIFSNELLNSSECPLSSHEKMEALQKLNRRQLVIFAHLIKRLSFSQALNLYNSLPVSLKTMVKASF